MQEEMSCAIRAMMREQSSQERGNKRKLLQVPLADQPPGQLKISFLQKQNIQLRTFKTCSYHKD